MTFHEKTVNGLTMLMPENTQHTTDHPEMIRCCKQINPIAYHSF